MPGIESFNRRRQDDEASHVVLNARSIPALEAGIANIKLGVFSVVCRRVSANWKDPKCGVALAHAVKCAIFGEPSDPIRLESVINNPQDVLAFEIKATVADDSLGSAIALEYAAEIIICAWRTATAGASLRASSNVVERAVGYGIEIPNIVEMWGMSAIKTFFLSSIDFMQRSVVVETL
jgi:hypothetical protein